MNQRRVACRPSGTVQQAHGPRHVLEAHAIALGPCGGVPLRLRILPKRPRRLLPQRFNDQKFLHGHTVIRHFSKRLFYTPYPHTENIKQWQVEKVHKRFGYTCFDDILNEYLSIKENLQ